jgi:1-acyl-sn-glycerol-3-phosphate acyltransferase
MNGPEQGPDGLAPARRKSSWPLAGASPLYSSAAFRVFDLFFAPWRRTRLQTAPILGLPGVVGVAKDRPLVIVANHTSWWDGFLLRDVHLALRGSAPMHTVMMASELRRQPFLHLLGAMPLQAGSSSSLLRCLRTLRTATRKQPDTSLLFFPQGRIWPSWRRPLGFQRGVELFLRSLAPCYVLPVGLHIEALNRVAPTAFVTLGRIRRFPEEPQDAAALERSVESLLDSLTSLLQTHGESLPAQLSHQSTMVLPVSEKEAS